MAGGQLFGFVGVLVGLPVAAIIAVLLRHAKQEGLHSPMYGAAAPLVVLPDDSRPPDGDPLP